MSSSANGSSADHDPVRSSPPEDPWLTEAPTSAFSEAGATSAFGETGATSAVGETGATANQPPLADTARFGDPVLVESPPAPGRRNRRAVRWIVAVLAAAALFIAGMLAIDKFGSGADDSRDALGAGPSTGVSSGPDPAPTSAPSAAPAGGPAGGPTSGPAGGSSAEAGGGPADATTASSSAESTTGPVVVYQVTASGSKNTGSVSYTDQDGDIIRLNGIALPWRVTFPLGGRQKPPLVLISQRKGGGNAGPVTCTITLDGKLLSSTTAEGRYAAPQCSG